MSIENLIGSLEHQFVGKQGAVISATPHSQEQAALKSALARYTFRRPSEVLSQPDDPNASLVGDFILSKGSPLVISGQGGIGKSFMLLQLATACITGQSFLGFETRAKSLRWLIFQAENSNRRLKADFSRLHKWVGDGDFDLVNESLKIHVLEDEQDFFMDLSSDCNIMRIQAALDEFQPDIVAIDPLQHFGIGDLNKDADMTKTCLKLKQTFAHGNRDRAIVVLHHALTGASGAAKATGLDRASFARNSKVLHSWARAMINVTPATEDYSKLVVACGKNNDGPEFTPFGVHRDTETLIFERDPDFDLSAWQTERNKGKSGKKAVPPEAVAGVLGERSLKKPDLVREIRTRFGLGQSSAYELINKSEGVTIELNPISKTYSVRSATKNPQTVFAA